MRESPPARDDLPSRLGRALLIGAWERGDTLTLRPHQ